MDEPSVLDFVKSRLMPWKYPKIEFPEQLSAADAPPRIITPVESEPAYPAEPIVQTEHPREALLIGVFPWRSLLALLFAFGAQFCLRPTPERDWRSGVILLIIAVSLLLWSNLRKELITVLPPPGSDEIDTTKINRYYLIIGAVLSLLSFASFSGLQFTVINLGILLLTLIVTITAFWVPLRAAPPWYLKLKAWIKSPSFSFTITPSIVFSLIAIAIVVFFRFYRLEQVPPEMNSDHAEKIFDIMRVLDGNNSIFFPNNGGREALQMYAVAALHRTLGIPLNFMALKWVTVLTGFFSLPFIYLLGREVGKRRIGVLAFLLAGIAYWPNVVSRVGLRLPFYLLFTASTLYFLLGGIRTSRRNQFIFAGISLGLSLYGYSADRILPLLVVIAVVLYLIHPQSKKRRSFIVVSTLALILVSFIIFIPLLRFILIEPDAFMSRTLTRMADLEQPLQAPAWIIFLNNTWHALTMFSWDAGEVWPISIPHSPALGIVSGGLFYIGAVLVLIRYIRNRNWIDIFLLISIPILLLPSIMALAFPAENPNLYRTGGALIPVFLMVAVALDALMETFIKCYRKPWGSRFSWGIAVILIGFAILQNYDLVFNRYYKQYQLSAWNTSEMGIVAENFTKTIGTSDTVWVMGFPHWVDTRLVPIIAGYPGKDYQLYPNQIRETISDERPKLFLLNPQDTEAIETLKKNYPNGWFQEYKSKVETKNFLMFFVPPLDISDR